jgi:hypothetical protein
MAYHRLSIDHPLVLSNHVCANILLHRENYPKLPISPLLTMDIGPSHCSTPLGETLNLYVFRESDRLSLICYSLLVLLIVISYVPQYVRIRSFRSTYGLSPYFILFRSLYATSSLANLLVVPSTWRLQQFCREHDPIGQCLLEMTDHWQGAADWIGSQIL